MTCIVGITNGASIILGGERGASDESTIVSMNRPKVYVRDEWIYGYAGTIGIGQLMNYITMPPPEGDIERLIRLNIVEELKKSLESYGRDTDNHDTSWLIGAQGRLFEFSTQDWGVIEVYETAIGGGSQIALGSLYTSIPYIEDNRERVTMALHSAITYSPNCQGPIDIVQLGLS